MELRSVLALLTSKNMTELVGVVVAEPTNGVVKCLGNGALRVIVAGQVDAMAAFLVLIDVTCDFFTTVACAKRQRDVLAALLAEVVRALGDDESLRLQLREGVERHGC